MVERVIPIFLTRLEQKAPLFETLPTASQIVCQVCSEGEALGFGGTIVYACVHACVYLRGYITKCSIVQCHVTHVNPQKKKTYGHTYVLTYV